MFIDLKNNGLFIDRNNKLSVMIKNKKIFIEADYFTITISTFKDTIDLKEVFEKIIKSNPKKYEIPL